METLWTEYGVLAVGASLILSGCVFTLDRFNWGWLDIIPGHRGRKMKRDRREYLLGMASDKFTSDIMDWIMEEEITTEEANELYLLLKRSFNSKHLFPSEVLLKEAIQKRLASGVHAPVPLPSDKVKRKSLFEKLPV